MKQQVEGGGDGSQGKLRKGHVREFPESHHRSVLRRAGQGALGPEVPEADSFQLRETVSHVIVCRKVIPEVMNLGD